MNIEETRRKYPTFRYQSFEVKKSSDSLSIVYHFRIASDIEFAPQVTFPLYKTTNTDNIQNFAFHLGLVEVISYWKSTCSPQFLVEAGRLTDQQISWWHDLFIHGLGEFFYKNGIDFGSKNFLTISSLQDAPEYPTVNSDPKPGDLVMVGGGKDSAVCLDVIRGVSGQKNVLLLNPTPAAINVSKTAGYNSPIIVKRELDQKLLELNRKGYLNGHTPFSAYLAFLGIFAGHIYGFKNVIVANEQSAGEGNVRYHNLEINHQYSKSYRFERLFQEYTQAYLTGGVSYFSMLRPVGELQITALYSQISRFDSYINSCNAGRGQNWCKTCPKCAFVYLVMSALMDRSRIKKIFGDDELFNSEIIQKHILNLTGIAGYKPFECVGTIEESKQALLLGYDSYQKQNLTPPAFLCQLVTTNTFKSKNVLTIKKQLKTKWSRSHFLPANYKNILKNRLEKMKI